LTDIEQYPSNEVIKVGMKVLVELKKDKGTGNLTEGIVQKKLSIIAHDPNGIVVKIEHGQQGRVHKIIDPDFIGKDSKKTLITLRHGEYLSNRIKIVDLLSNADDFIWLLVGYFKHNHFDILREVLDNNKNIKDIKIITGLPFTKKYSVEDIEFKKIILYADAFKKQFPNIVLDLKFLTDKKIGEKTHARFYFTKNQAWSFIDLDIMLRAQREILALQSEEDLEKNIENDFNYFWNQPTTLSLFGDEKGILLQKISEINNKAQV